MEHNITIIGHQATHLNFVHHLINVSQKLMEQQ